jgi:hypothetical protein
MCLLDFSGFDGEGKSPYVRSYCIRKAKALFIYRGEVATPT